MTLPPLLHRFDLTPREAVRVQHDLALRVSYVPETGSFRRVAGIDCAYADGRCHAAVAVWDSEIRRVVETRNAYAEAAFPYVPGLLSFRELPAVWEALSELEEEPDVLLCDAHGYAHPRRFGLACHIGVLTGLSSVGCAKSLLVGECAAPGQERGECSPIFAGEDEIGSAVRTRRAVKPVYVSVGHRVDLATAVRVVLDAACRYRLPEPARHAHRLATAQARAV